MRAVLTRVSQAAVRVDGEIIGAIDCPDTGGLLALVGVTHEDGAGEVKKMAEKIANLRLLDGELSVLDAGGPVLVVSQFTLYGRTAKGRRPSWSDAAPGPVAEPLIEKLVAHLRDMGLEVATGRFGADMQVSSVNEGPFTVLVEI